MLAWPSGIPMLAPRKR